MWLIKEENEKSKDCSGVNKKYATPCHRTYGDRMHVTTTWERWAIGKERLEGQAVLHLCLIWYVNQSVNRGRFSMENNVYH